MLKRLDWRQKKGMNSLTSRAGKESSRLQKKTKDHSQPPSEV